MNKKFWLMFAACFVATVACAAGWHMFLFKGFYESTGVRTEPLLNIGLLATAIQAACIAYLYPIVYRGGKPVTEGAKFGLIVGLLLGSHGAISDAINFNLGSLTTWATYEGAFFLVTFTIVGAVCGQVHGTQRGSASRMARAA